MKIILQILLTVIQTFAVLFFMEKILYNTILKPTKKQILLTLGFCFVFYGLFLLPNNLKVLCSILLQILFAKVIFSESISRISVAVLYLFVLICCSDLIVAFLLSFFNLSPNIFSLLGNFLTLILTFFFFSWSVAMNYKNLFFENERIIILLGSIFLISIYSCLIIFYDGSLPFDKLKLLFGSFGIYIFLFLYFMFVEKGKNALLRKQHRQIIEYFQTADKLMDNYRIVNHERKNQLIIIRSMTKDKNVVEFIDQLLSKEPVDLTVAVDLAYLPSILLRGFLSYKILEIRRAGIKCYVNVSKEVEKFSQNLLKNEENDLFIHVVSILGIFLDNATEEVQNLKEKEIDILIGVSENNSFKIEIANTARKNICLEEILVDHKTTKGKSRGVGLLLVQSILKEHPEIINRTEIIGGLFVQSLEVQFKMEDET